MDNAHGHGETSCASISNRPAIKAESSANRVLHNQPEAQTKSMLSESHRLKQLQGTKESTTNQQKHRHIEQADPSEEG